MNEKRCLYCYQLLPKDATDFHEYCSRKFFGSAVPPILDYGNEQMQELAREIVIRSVTVTGVQPKLSLTIEKVPGHPKKSRLTIVGLWGSYILKPPTAAFPNLPENEDLTMHLSELFGIPTASHSLIRLQSGELAYITKRFDRINNSKLALEDMCQLTETLTSDKYRSSMEKVGKCITKYSTSPGIDHISFFETALLSFLTGNADMHLKNYSLLTTSENDIKLAPAYDLVCTKIAMPEDRDEMGLSINARKRKLRKSDFDSLATNLKISEKSMNNIYKRFANKLDEAFQLIDISFLPETLKATYKKIITQRAEKLDLNKS
jgi:serine/threonine-protein kinase HipA